MSGHSKWSTIKHQKGTADKKRGQLFSRLVKLITLSAKKGGTDPDVNFKLRLAIDKAKSANMPKANIDNALKRAAGASSADSLQEIIYEGFGPSQEAILVECITDNSNRTLSEVKSYFEKKGGALGSAGSVSYMFEKKGLVRISKTANPDEQELQLMDLNPDEIINETGYFVLLCPYQELADFAKSVKTGGSEVNEYYMTYQPKNTIELPAPQKEKLMVFLSGLSELEDVEDYYTNIIL